MFNAKPNWSNEHDSQNGFEVRVLSVVKRYLSSSSFSAKKVTDTPTDSNQVTPRGYVNMNGTTANRPTSSIIGQFYFDTTLGQPVWWSGDTFVDASGNPA